MSLNHPLLDPHGAIAWDLDGTLVEGPNMGFFRRFIVERRDIAHHVVTFRSPADVPKVSALLEDNGVPPDMLAGIHACPPELLDAYREGMRCALYDRFMRWKGEKSAELGCTLLVDDMRELVILGCEGHGVAYVDSWAMRTFPRIRYPDIPVPSDDLDLVGGPDAPGA